MPKIHPITIIVFGLLLISLGFNALYLQEIKQLKEQKATIIIRPNIRLYQPPDNYYITKYTLYHGAHE